MTPRPTEPIVTVTREPEAGECPHCGRAELARYPVVSEQGWEQVVKCQACLTSVRREPWRALGPVELLVDQLP
jgi:vanillate/4-hydroxybenzoate decarboxylase subunit D